MCVCVFVCVLGPGAYNIFDYGLANESLKKAQLDGKRTGGFGSTAKRTTIFISKTTEPGPSHYMVCTTHTASMKYTLYNTIYLIYTV